MKRKLFLLVLSTIFSTLGYSQVRFEKGYFISEYGKKIECLIKYQNWGNNPTRFKYKESETGKVQTATMESVKEFGVLNHLRYKRSTVKIDRSNSLSRSKEPEFKEETLFLKQIIQGDASLYSYKSDDLKGRTNYFFYEVNGNGIQQLIYKSYLAPSNITKTNYAFKAQLSKDLRDDGLGIDDIKALEYKQKDLVAYFNQYHKVKNSTYVNYEENLEKKTSVHLNIRPGISNTSFSIFNTSENVDFGNEINLSYGLEVEIFLPLRNKNWSLLAEIRYLTFDSESEIRSQASGIQSVNADYESIDLYLGARHYYSIGAVSKIFLNGLFMVNLSDNTKIDFERATDIEATPSSNIALGVGYKYKNKLSLESRYEFKNNVLQDTQFWSADFSNFSVIIGYTIF